MSSNTCTYTLKLGNRAGQQCGEPVTKNNLCGRCNAREELTLRLQNEGQGNCSHYDPYNGPGTPCERPQVFQGYCFLCLSQY